MIPPPETRYAASEAGYVAFQVFGNGPLTVLLVTSWLQNLDVMWDEPSLAHYLDRLASFSRVICFDKRGSGVSDPVPLSALPSIEQWMDDGRTVLDAAGDERAAVIGDTEGGPMAIMLAASLPERVSRSAPASNSTSTRPQRTPRGRAADPVPISPQRASRHPPAPVETVLGYASPR